MIHRREFLRLSAAGALAASLPLQTPTAPAVPKKKRALRKAVGIGMIDIKGSLLDKFSLLAELGFEGVEIDSPSDLKPDEVVSALEKTGLQCSGVVDSAHWSSPFSSADEAVRKKGREALATALADAKRYKATSVLLVPAVVNENTPYDLAWERSTAEIKALLPKAQEAGVKIAIENVWNNFIMSPLEAARFVDQFESPWVGWHFDIGNVITYGWPEQWIRILGKRILKLHVKEYSRKKRDDIGLWHGFDVELGYGDNNWPAVMKALDEIGYAGWGTAEVRGGDRERLKYIADRMDQLFAC